MNKKELEDYINNMKIPEAKDVLPSDCIRAKQKEEEINMKKSSKKYLITGSIGTVVCCAAIATLVIAPWNRNYTNQDTSKKSGTYKDGVIGEKKQNVKDSIAGHFAEKFDMAVEEGAVDSTGSEVLYDEEVAENSYGDIVAGTLTGGEIRDLKNWDNWLRTLDKDTMNIWNLIADSRFRVHVSNEGTAINNVKVRLISNQELIYEATTDVNGDAYLFYNFHKDDNITPDIIEVEQQDGSFKSFKISEFANNNNELELTSDLSDKDIKMDLMYVVDTTGSMGDELDYLKAEIKNVIERVESEAGVSIRTSANFYRDEGDEYVVKYFDFRDNASEVADLVGEQNAEGGGDYEEAVHTALNNAINEHDWSDESSVKLMFLVLDAPPHNSDDIVKQLSELIETASSKGIRIIPVAASGAMEDTQQLLRTFAVMTGGTFLFLDDNSGVGYSHDVPLEPNEYNSEYFNDMMIRVIGEYCGVEIQPTEVETETQVPETTEYVQ